MSTVANPDPTRPPSGHGDPPGLVRVTHLTKSFGGYVAVDDLSFEMHPGRVTAFLGPNGAGKTTTLRMVLGLVHATSGRATIGGTAYRDLAEPMHTVGAALEATSFHPGRTGRDHLRVLAAAAGLPEGRADAMLEMTGIASAARKRAGAYSLGMRQRLGLAAAMLGDPQVLILDEPANGLDPDGIRWLRGFLRALAAEGRTVIMSSHLLAEVEHTVDDVVLISRGRLAAAGTVEELRGAPTTYVRTPDRPRLAAALAAAGFAAQEQDDGLLVETGDLASIGDAALQAGVAVHELRPTANNLEDLYFRLTAGGSAHATPMTMSQVRPQ